MKSFFTLLVFALFTTANAQTVLTQWNFNTAPASTPSTGTGTITSIGGTTNTTASGSGSSDPTQPGLGYQTTNYPAATANDKTAGIEIAVNTTGFSGIYLRFDIRASNTAANEYIIQYSSDGTTFTDFATLDIAAASGGVFVNGNEYNLSSITALDNNPNVKFRVVSSFDGDPGTTYVGVNGTYGTTGTVRFDMVSVLRLSVTPITFKSFSATTNNNNVSLKWLIANESNMKSYTVEKSENGINFTPITTIAAKNSIENNYQYTDALVSKNTLYYRIKIEDVNGKITYSSIARVDNIDAKFKLTVFPTVTTSSITAKIKADKNTQANLQIIDAVGKTTIQKTWNISTGVNTIPIDINNLPKGVYHLRVIGENINEISSFIKN